MAVRGKPGAKLFIVLLAAAAAILVYRRANRAGEMRQAKVMTSHEALTGGDARPSRYKLALSEWPGHMPFVIGNGGLTSTPGSAAAELGLDLEIVFIEDAGSKNRALRDDKVDFVWQTVDELPINMSGFKQAGAEVRAFLQIDWS